MKRFLRLITGIFAVILLVSSCGAGTSGPATEAGTEATTPVTDAGSTTAEAPATEAPAGTTQAPVTTQVPGTTQAPGTTSAPITTQTPGTTQTPVTTATPTTQAATTKAPETTKAPVTTQAPITTKAPETTQAPTAQGASFVTMYDAQSASLLGKDGKTTYGATLPLAGYQFNANGFHLLSPTYSGTNLPFSQAGVLESFDLTKNNDPAGHVLSVTFTVDTFAYQGGNSSDEWICLSLTDKEKVTPGETAFQDGYFLLIRGKGDGKCTPQPCYDNGNTWKCVKADYSVTVPKSGGKEVYTFVVDYSGGNWKFTLNGKDIGASDATMKSVLQKIQKKAYFHITVQTRAIGSANNKIEYTVNSFNGAVPKGTAAKSPVEAAVNPTAAQAAFRNDNFAATYVTKSGKKLSTGLLDSSNPGVLALLSECMYFESELQKGIARGEKWVYSNSSTYVPQKCSFDEMVASGKTGTNCAMGQAWALIDMGLLPNNNSHLYGYDDLSLKNWTKSYNGTTYGKILNSVAVVTDWRVDGAQKYTFKNVYTAGKVKGGDIFFCKGHTFIYLGDELFLATGHDGKWHKDSSANTEDGNKAVFETWIRDMKSNSNYNHGITYQLRFKDAYIPRYYRNSAGKLVPNPMYNAATSIEGTATNQNFVQGTLN